MKWSLCCSTFTQDLSGKHFFALTQRGLFADEAQLWLWHIGLLRSWVGVVLWAHGLTVRASALNLGNVYRMSWSAEGRQPEWHPDSWWLIAVCWNDEAKELVYVTPRAVPQTAALTHEESTHAQPGLVSIGLGKLLLHYSSGLALEVSKHNWAAVKPGSNKVTRLKAVIPCIIQCPSQKHILLLWVYKPFDRFFTLFHAIRQLLFKLMNDMLLLKMFQMWESIDYHAGPTQTHIHTKPVLMVPLNHLALTHVSWPLNGRASHFHSPYILVNSHSHSASLHSPL